MGYKLQAARRVKEIHRSVNQFVLFEESFRHHAHQLRAHALERVDGAGEEVVGKHLHRVLVALADEAGQLLAVGGEPDL